MRQPCQTIVASLEVLMWSVFYYHGVIGSAHCVDKPDTPCKAYEKAGACETDAFGMLGVCCRTCCGADTITAACCERACIHGTCIIHQYKAKCNCNGTGYVGDNCDLNVCFFNKNPCINNGECINNYDGTLNCDCTGTGYTGQNCSDDECKTKNPCNHGGKCINHGNGTLSCDCAGTGYTGEHCDIDECKTKNSCLHGKCINNGDGTLSCDCTGTWYTGQTCDMVYCETKPCVRGHCMNIRDGFSCDCTGTGYIGDLCTTACSSLLNCGIHNSTDQTGSVCVCACLDGYTNGDLQNQTCVDVDECLSQREICGEKKCVNIPGSFKCTDVASAKAKAESSSFIDSFPGKAIGLGLAIGAILVSSVGAAMMIGNVFSTMTGNNGLFKHKGRKIVQDIDADDMKNKVVLSKISSSSSSASKPSPSPSFAKNDEASHIDIQAFIRSCTSFSLSSLLKIGEKPSEVDITIDEEMAEPDKSCTKLSLDLEIES